MSAKKLLLIMTAAILAGCETPSGWQDSNSGGTNTLTVHVYPAGGGLVDTVGSDNGSGTRNIRLTAVPDSGYEFLGWLGNVSSDSSDTTIVCVGGECGSKTVTAIFVDKSFRVLITGDIFNSIGRLGYLWDTRDFQMYVTILMPDGKTWMMQNLNYNGTGSWCFDESSAYCETYGRLYNWDAAVKACPSGWRLPTDQEWTELGISVGGNIAGRTLRSQPPDWNGTNDFLFTALPAGGRDAAGNFFGHRDGYWWTATENGGDYAFTREMTTGDDGYICNSHLCKNSRGKEFGFSVRCIRN
ncbi:MAG: hypothetical protein LBI42_08195 [Chitinispirillales bacterium]|jgi:uncharacterized protein (TIGR02145 family)|nr:hypothetical protein [Chitinispirillales bacterium]